MISVVRFAVGLLLSLQLVQGAVTLVTDRDLLGGNDLITWWSLPNHSYPDAPLMMQSTGGNVTATVFGEIPGGFWRLDQGDGWDGNFPAGDALLVNLWRGDLTIEFSTPVKAAGAQMQHYYYGPFSETLRAYDSEGDLLGSFFVEAYSGHPTDAEAAFIGVSSDAADISRIVLSTVEFEEFAINAVSVQVVPEPSTGVVLTAGILLVASRRIRTRLNASDRFANPQSAWIPPPALACQHLDQERGGYRPSS
jgi:hypothetical protein